MFKIFGNFFGCDKYLANFWTYFGKFSVLLGQFTLFEMAKYWANIPGIWSHWWGLCFSHWASCLVFCWSQWYQLVMSPGSLQYLDVYGVSFFILFYSIFFSWSSLSPFILIFPQPVAVICAPPSPIILSRYFLSANLDEPNDVEDDDDVVGRLGMRLWSRSVEICLLDTLWLGSDVINKF